MKIKLTSLLRAASFAAALFALSGFASAKGREAPDRPRELLALNGSVFVTAAGPYVEIGTFQIQVVAKLGQPVARLSDGSWFYPNFRVEGSEAAGTLLVRFEKGRVSGLLLVTPAVAQALQKGAEQIRVASQK